MDNERKQESETFQSEANFADKSREEGKMLDMEVSAVMPSMKDEKEKEKEKKKALMEEQRKQA
jgi:hypothetical protein